MANAEYSVTLSHLTVAVAGVQSGWDCFGYEYNRPTKDVVIRNVTAVYSEAAGCAIGSEMSGGMENITVREKSHS